MTQMFMLQVPSLRFRMPELQEDGRPQHECAPEGFQGGQKGTRKEDWIEEKTPKYLLAQV